MESKPKSDMPTELIDINKYGDSDEEKDNALIQT